MAPLPPPEPRSLQDLQKMRVDDLIQWLARNKADNLPPRAEVSLELPIQVKRIQVKPKKQLSTEQASTSNEIVGLSIFPRVKLVRKIGAIEENNLALVGERNAARLNAFNEEVEKLKTLCTAYDAICEDIKYEDYSSDEWENPQIVQEPRASVSSKGKCCGSDASSVHEEEDLQGSRFIFKL